MSNPAEEPVWTDEALMRLLGACDGYVHAMLAVKMKIGSFDSAHVGRLHPRHVRKIERRDAITKPLRELCDQLESDLRRCQAVYRTQSDRRKAALILEM